MAVLQIGAGGVGWVVAHKLAQYNDVFGDITLASRTVAKCDTIIESILRKNNLKDTTKRLTSAAVDADSVEELASLLKWFSDKYGVQIYLEPGERLLLKQRILWLPWLILLKMA